MSAVSFEDQSKTNGYRRDVHFRSGGSEVRCSGIGERSWWKVVSAVSFEDQSKTNGYRRDV